MAVSIHEEFDASDADVVFQSSDGVQFHLHRKNLEAVAGAFPGPEFETNGEIASLAEPADVLQILFKFVYPRRHPDLEDLDFSMVAAIAEAAGKYEVFPAINTCITRLRHYIPNHPLEVLLHGIKHDYPKLINEAAPHVLFSPTLATAEKLPPSWVLPWLRFTEESRAIIFRMARKYLKARNHYDSGCYPNDDLICLGCRYSLSAWIDELEMISNRSSLHSALHSHQGYWKQHLCGKCPNQCVFLQAVVEILKNGFDSTPPLTHFLLPVALTDSDA